MNQVAAREEICRVGRSLFDRGYVHATAGNISVKLDEGEGGGYLITPTDACLGFLDPEGLARVDASGVQTGGERASKTLALHRCIYAADPDARCVIHTHSTRLVALSLVGAWSAADVVPPITPYFVMKVGHVPLIPYRRPGDPEVGGLVTEAIGEARRRGAPRRAVMLERLGPVVWHQTPAAAMGALEELEETACLWLMTRPVEPLSQAQIDELRHAFGAQW
jgi:ribulose-5-phosphate 4-epimerase/fuculose-1-phosphate aldolase